MLIIIVLQFSLRNASLLLLVDVKAVGFCENLLQKCFKIVFFEPSLMCIKSSNLFQLNKNQYSDYCLKYLINSANIVIIRRLFHE